jgi:cytochrome c553
MEAPMSYLIRVARHTAFLVALPGAACSAHAAGLPADAMAQRLAACTSCHAAKAGQEAFFPRISGKPEGYLYNQLLNFRDGRRQSPMMTYMVEHLPDAYLREIAAYFAADAGAPHARQLVGATVAQLERGRQLATIGDAANKVPACIACHGEQLGGVAPAIPGLAGLPRDYVNAQLGAWRNASRRARAPDCMASIVGRLSQADVSAVSAWLATRPVPAGQLPAAAIARPLPVACGSSPD